MGRVEGPSGKSGTGRGTLGEVRNRSGDLRVGEGQVRGPTRRSGTDRGTYGEVQDGSVDYPRGLGWDGEPSGRSGTCRLTLGEVRDGSEHPRKGPKWVGGPPGVRAWSGDPWVFPGRVGGPSGRSGTDRGTHGEVQDGSVDYSSGPGWAGGHSRRSRSCRSPCRRSTTSQRIFFKVRDRSENPRRVPGLVGGPTGKSRTCRWTIPEGRDGPVDTRGGPGHVGVPVRGPRRVGGSS